VPIDAGVRDCISARLIVNIRYSGGTLKELILHVGFHKTATSSFQATCVKNRELLADQGIYYPSFSLGNKTINNHSAPIASLFSEHPSSLRVNVIQGHEGEVNQVREQFEKILGSQRNTLISGEGISMLSGNALGKLKEQIEAQGFTIRVLCSVRKPYAFTCSSFQQLVKGGILSSFVEEKVPTKSKRVQVLKRIFDHVEFFSFESDCAFQGGPVAAMLDRINVELDEVEYVNTNEGMGNITTRLYASINAKYPIVKKEKLSQRGRHRGKIDFDNDKFLLTRTEIEALREELDEENRSMREALGNDFTDREYRASSGFRIDKELAVKIIKQACRPAYVADAVIKFLVEHNDGTWAASDLFEPLLEKTEISEVTVDYLRDQAILNEGENLQLAHDLMLLAFDRRPEGLTIRTKLAKYRQQLDPR
jgi:hypothetical protein